MSTVNIVLMIILSVIVGFEIGNIYGRESIKKMLSNMITQFIKNVESASKNKKEE